MLTPDSTTCKVSALLLALALAGCAGKTETQSYVVNQGSSVESSQVAVGADFSGYSKLHAVDMGIFFPDHAVTSSEDLQRIRDIFRSAFLAELEGYDIVTEPAPDAMTVAATLIDFRNATYQDTMSVQSRLRSMATPGKIVFTMELRDSESDKVLARAADSAKTPAIADEAGEATDWAGVEDAARHWASLFREFLDENFEN
jgi:hypothetical protein